MNRRSWLQLSSILLAVAPAVYSPFDRVEAQAGTGASLPQAHYAELNPLIDEKDSLAFSISLEGDLYLGREKITKEKFSLKIWEVLEDLPPDRQKIFIKCGSDVKFASIRELLNIFRHMGFDNVGYVVESVSPPGKAAEFDTRIFIPNGIKIASSDMIDLPERPRRPQTNVAPPPPPPVAAGDGVPGGVPGGMPGGEPAPRLIRKTGGELARSATRRVEPVTPPMARQVKVSGVVVVEVIIDEKGNVIAARALSGHPLLKDTAVDAAWRWKFAPAKIDGEPVKVIGTITLTFK